MSMRTVALALAVSAALPAAAQAATAFASNDVHVRAGPATGFRIVGRLHDGERVQVDRCTTGYAWCHVSHRGRDGWVAARFLYDRRYGRRRPLSHFGLNLDIPQLNLHVGIGPQGRKMWPNRPPRGPAVVPGERGPRGYRSADRGPGRRGHGSRMARVCFYEDFNFGGKSFCADAGQNDRSLGQDWNDRISSIRVMGGARVRVCEDFDYAGRCHVVSRDRRRLTGRNNDIISSYRVM